MAGVDSCPGTVVVHRDLAVSCTSGGCAHLGPRAYWFSLHASFVRCGEAGGSAEGCPDCGFVASTPARDGSSGGPVLNRRRLSAD